jgi:hypothetical protein
MARLLNRVRDAGGEQTNETPRPLNDRRKRRDNEPVYDEPAYLPQEEIPMVEAVTAKLTPRTVAPELSSDLRAMRDLANMSARAAIDRHTCRNWGRAAVGKLAIAVLAAGTGAAALLLAPANDPILTYAGWTSLVVALFWFLQAGILTCNVIIASRRAWSHDAVEDGSNTGGHIEYEEDAADYEGQSDEPAAEITHLTDGNDSDLPNDFDTAESSG